MSIESVRDALLWCAVINYGLLLAWVLVYRVARERVHRLWGRWFHLSGEQFDTLSFTAVALYKVGILLLNVVPYIALLVVG